MSSFFAVYDTIDREVVSFPKTWSAPRSPYRQLYGIKVKDRWFRYEVAHEYPGYTAVPLKPDEVPEAVRLAYMLLS
jgi:hypothetical protein